MLLMEPPAGPHCAQGKPQALGSLEMSGARSGSDGHRDGQRSPVPSSAGRAKDVGELTHKLTPPLGPSCCPMHTLPRHTSRALPNPRGTELTLNRNCICMLEVGSQGIWCSARLPPSASLQADFDLVPQVWGAWRAPSLMDLLLPLAPQTDARERL